MKIKILKKACYINLIILISFIFSIQISCIAFSEINHKTHQDTPSNPCYNAKSDNCPKCNLEQGYNFGLKIQNAIRSRDLQLLFSFINGELQFGHLRKKYIKNKKFNEVFSEDWRKAVLDTMPSCEPLGYRGFLLGNGSIWYDYNSDNQVWHIITINGAINGELPNKKSGKWRIDDQILGTKCFVYEWGSGENFEEFAKKYNLKRDQKHNDLNNVGLYFGIKIPLEDSFDFNHNNLSLTTDIEDCTVKKLTKEGTYPYNYYCNACENDSYRIVDNIPQRFCKQLAPHIYDQCKSMKLISIHQKGGSMRFENIGIYGHFKLKDNKSVILPLKYFNSINDAKNFIDDMIDNSTIENNDHPITSKK